MTTQPGKLIHTRRKRTVKPPSTRLDKAAAATLPKRLMIINMDGSRLFEPVETDTDKQLAQLQRIVGGYIELVPYPAILDGKKAHIFVNEDGLSLGLPTNVSATGLTGGIHHIVGVAVVVPAEVLL